MENPETALEKPLLPMPHERLMATLAHLSVLMPLFGWLIAFTFWFANRGDARYAAYQAKQACFFQIFMGFICFASWFSSELFLWNVTPAFGPFNFHRAWQFLFSETWAFCPLVCLVVYASSYGLVGAIYCAWGLDFRYRFLGLWLRPE